MARNVLLFDIDGTLIWSHGAGRGAIEAAMKQEFGDAANVDGIPFHGRTDRAIVRDAFRQCGIDDTPSHRHRILDAYIANLPRFLTNRPGCVLPGVVALLDRLSEMEVEIGLLTGNIRRGASVKLRNYGLDDRFAFGGFGDEHVDRNDVAVEALKVVKDRLGNGIQPRDVWVIGDTPSDVQCGRHIGARVLAVATGGADRNALRASEPDALLDDFADIQLALSALELR